MQLFGRRYDFFGLGYGRLGTETLGLLGMRERADLMLGDVKLIGVAGQGTVVTIRVRSLLPAIP
jgi:signal transduction histidine kinase